MELIFVPLTLVNMKVPLDGFQALQGAEGVKLFNIHKAYGSHLLPTSHTCFNQLDLPEYGSEELTRERLLVAIHEGSEGFGFA
jgi:E3 ubiquitin-protein ligase HUWE1